MDPFLAVILLGLPLAWLVAFAVYAYHDAPNHGLNPGKWAAISFFVPLFGFFAYLFERGEATYDPEEDSYAQGQAFGVHESRRGEDPIEPGGADREEDVNADGAAETTETVPRRNANVAGETDEEDDEWTDPPGVDG